MGKMAILVDGGFYLKRAKSIKGAKSPRLRANELIDYCNAHLANEEADLYRIYYYDCDPIAKKAFHPLHNRTFDQSKTEEYGGKHEFFEELSKKRKLAIRKGEVLEGSCEFVLKSSVAKDLIVGKRDHKSLADDDFVLDVQQKGIDVRIGLDVALIAHEKFADQILLITGDSDFVPAAKYARRHGIDFIVDPMWHNFRPELGVHVDGMHTPWPKPRKRKATPKKAATQTKTSPARTKKKKAV